MGARFAWGSWWRYYRALLRLRTPGAVPEALIRASLAVAAELGWSLDHPAPPPEDVLIVIGHQRSGTTWLHRLLAADPGACALPLHALLFPADSWQWLFRRLGLPAWLARREERLFAPFDPIHRIRLGEPEEDEFLLWALFRSPMNALDRPWPRGQEPAIEADAAALRFYAEAVAKAVRRTGRRYVGKNPHFTHRTDAVRAALPAVRFVQVVRHPAQAIASRLSLLREIWRRRVPGFVSLAPHQVEAIYRNSIRCYLGGHERADFDVAYPDLVGDPMGTVERIHRELGLPAPDPSMRRIVECTSCRAAAKHGYDLADFGLARERLAEDLAPVYSRWGFRP